MNGNRRKSLIHLRLLPALLKKGIKKPRSKAIKENTIRQIEMSVNIISTQKLACAHPS